MDHIAVDLGGRESQICVRSETGALLEEKRVATTKLVDYFKERPQSRVILETCAEAFAVATSAKAAGHDVRIVPATLVRALGVGHRGIKTDQRDARALSEASVRVELASVHVPTETSRDVKGACGMREETVQARTQLINCVRGWLRKELLRVRTGGTPTFPARVRECCEGRSRPIPASVSRLLICIEALSTQIAEADVELAAMAETDERCRLLMTVPGVGPITSLRFSAAVDEFDRFPNAHRLESYFGLTPGEDSSSDSRRRTSITKAGSRRVRWVMTQAAWCAYRTRPSDPMVVWALQVAKRRGVRVAVMALARKMAGIMFAMCRDKTSYDPRRASVHRAGQEPPVPIAEGPEVVHYVAALHAEAPSEAEPKLVTTPADVPSRPTSLRPQSEPVKKGRAVPRLRQGEKDRVPSGASRKPQPEQTGPRSASLRDPAGETTRQAAPAKPKAAPAKPKARQTREGAKAARPKTTPRS